VFTLYMLHIIVVAAQALTAQVNNRSYSPISDLHGSFCGSVPFIIDNKITFNDDGTTDLDFNVKIAHKDVACKAEQTTTSATTVTFPNSASKGDCVGDALRSQKKDPSKYYLDINADGTLTFHSDGYPDLKMKPCTSSTHPSLTLEAEPCCMGACTAPKQKYFSIAKGIFGDRHCGECCMDPADYHLYHLFEKNLTKPSEGDVSPCAGRGYAKYDKTVTHGFLSVKMTLDLYDPSA